MTRLSANLGFLWPELDLPERIKAAHQAGFQAVECHWPYDTPVEEVVAALSETGLPMLGLNTQRGNLEAGENGLSAVPGREDEARAYIDQASAYAARLDCHRIHVMAGFTERDAAAEDVFRGNLTYACDRAARHGQTVLIEPLNTRDAPGYHLQTLPHALRIVEEMGLKNLKIMFDCYHLQIMGGDLLQNLKAALPHIGHIQIAAVPDRGEPDAGEINYGWLLKAIDGLGWDGWIGAEYKPRAGTGPGLGWIERLGLTG